MTFEKEKREVRGTPSSTSLSIYRLCVLSSLFLVARYFSYLFRDFRVVDTSGEFFGTDSYGKHRNKAVGMSSALPSYHSFPYKVFVSLATPSQKFSYAFLSCSVSRSSNGI
mgnify:CR=1 FL=1